MISAGLKKLIESNAMALATIRRNGTPHNIAVAYVKVIDSKLVISNVHIKESVKNYNLDPYMYESAKDSLWGCFIKK